MQHKGNGKTPPRKSRKPNGGPRQGAGDDPGFTATRASSSRADDAKGRDEENEDEAGNQQWVVDGAGDRDRSGNGQAQADRQQCCRSDEHPPVRAQVEDDDLVLVEQPARKRHPARRSP